MDQLPEHLKKYIVAQSPDQYTPVEQSTWRYILSQLTHYLSTQAHPDYLKGLEATGITLDKIPSIASISAKLAPIGWRALPVSGFIPPAAFMELQSLSVLPIATEMRTLAHLEYTPAPDIVHETAGHAPLLIVPEYSAYLKAYAQVSRRAILSKQDLEIYKRIRILSDLKENPQATAEQLHQAHQLLSLAVKNEGQVSEAALLARMNWWTAEYGLIGSLTQPKIYGAGLLSSVGESKSCLSSAVKKLPLTLDCLNYSYDITEPQPQLFVTPDFKHLVSVLNEFKSDMSFYCGGIKALLRSRESQVVNTHQLDSGLQISGELQSYLRDAEGHVCFLKFTGPTQLAWNENQLLGQGPDYHMHGYSTPLGRLENFNEDLKDWPLTMWSERGYQLGATVTFDFESGLQVKGVLSQLTPHPHGNTVIIASLSHALVTFRGDTLFEPSWGTFDMGIGSQVTAVWGGPADRLAYGESEDFEKLQVKPKSLSEKDQILHQHFDQLLNHDLTRSQLEELGQKHHQLFGQDWLFEWELDIKLGVRN